MKRHWRFLHSSRLDQVFKCSSSCKINDLLRDEDVDREDVDRENKDSFTRLAGRDVPSESESLVELEVAPELELGQLDDEYHLDFDLRFFDPSYAFGQVFLQLFQVCVFFRLNCRAVVRQIFPRWLCHRTIFARACSRSYFFRGY